MAGVLRVVRSVSIGALLFGFVATLALVLRVNRPGPAMRIEFSSGYGPGVVVLERADEIGPDPFADPVAVELDLDAALVARPPLNAEIFLSPHRRSSVADRLLAAGLGWDLALAAESDRAFAVDVIRDLARDHLGREGAIGELEDRNGDGRDDDGRFTVQAFDGSAVCVEIGPPRTLAASLGAAVDPEDGVVVGGLDWDPTGPCTDPEPQTIGREVRHGSTPGVYGGLRTGEVCDAGALIGHLEAVPAIGEAWALVRDIPPESLRAFISSLTPVVLLRDTLVTNFGWQNGRVIPRQSVLQRGTPVLIDRRGVPAVRCLSGSPLQAAAGLPAEPAFQGRGWEGFERDLIDEIPPAELDQSSFLLLDLGDGSVIDRAAGVDTALSRLAGPVETPRAARSPEGASGGEADPSGAAN